MKPLNKIPFDKIYVGMPVSRLNQFDGENLSDGKVICVYPKDPKYVIIDWEKYFGLGVYPHENCDNIVFNESKSK